MAQGSPAGAPGPVYKQIEENASPHPPGGGPRAPAGPP